MSLAICEGAGGPSAPCGVEGTPAHARWWQRFIAAPLGSTPRSFFVSEGWPKPEHADWDPLDFPVSNNWHNLP